MKEFDYIIIGGGCSGLSLAYELEINNKLENKTLAIIEPRLDYKRDKTWSFWKVNPHNFEDCVKKSWKKFSVKTSTELNYIKCDATPYQSIDSHLFYKKINNELSKNKSIKFFKNINDLNTKNSFIFNSVLPVTDDTSKLWQHFYGLEIEVEEDIFDDNTFSLMDFNCDQKNNVHFFYSLPFARNKALVETTWISRSNNDHLKDYEFQIQKYIIDNLRLKRYKINFREQGAIPLFYPSIVNTKNKINIGTAGGMTRLSTGYTFLNIQDKSKYIRKNIENIHNLKIYEIKKKYKFLDKLFLKVVEKNPKKMPQIFFNMFNTFAHSMIKFLSNKSNIFEDIIVILKMPKWIFIKAMFKKND